MNKKALSLLLVAALLVCAPGLALAKAKQMNDGVPVWTEQTVRDYAGAYVNGKIMNTLWGYYDLQIRRYLPMQTYETMLSELEWATGKFISLGSYRCFEEPEYLTKTHVLHFCMEKRDLDMYFTHKNKPDDWEVMAVEFVFADKETPVYPDEMLEDTALSSADAYDEMQVSIGSGDSMVGGTLTIPKEATAQNPVPACVIVHDWGMPDRDGRLGGTALYADLAHALGEMGIASIRYDAHALNTPATMQTTLEEEVTDNALAACEFMLNEDFIDKKRVVLIGHGFGAMLAPRIALASERKFTAMIMIAGAYTTPLKQLVKMDIEELNGASDAERAEIIAFSDGLKKMKRNQIAETAVLGRSGTYFAEIEKDDRIKQIKRLKMPTYIVQGDKDAYVPEDNGWRAYAEAIGDGATYMSFKSFRGLNHLLMADETLNADGMPDYSAEATLDEQAGKSISQWILNLFRKVE